YAPAGTSTWTTIGTDSSSPYSTSWDTTGVADGLYDLRVVATDLVGNSAPSATVANRRVDNTAPDTSITTQPTDPSNNTTPSFSFGSTETGSSFECRIDGGSWSPYTGPAPLSPQARHGTRPLTHPTELSDGIHTFHTRATDHAGNTDATPATYTWTLDTAAPNTSITAQPSDPSNNTTPSFSFASTETGSTFECRIDSGSWTA